MADDRQTMYELLSVPADAPERDIRAAHERASARLQAQSGQLGPDDIAARQRVLDWALQTLANPKLRAAYDARLLAQAQPAQAAQYASPVPPIILATQAEPATKSPLTRILTVIAGLMAAGLAFQLVYLLLVPYRNAAALSQETARIEGAVSPIEEKVILQEYYQEHGVRAGSRAEAELLVRQADLKEEEEREAKREKEAQEREYKRFLEESRRIGNEATASRERIEQAERAEAEQKRLMQSEGLPIQSPRYPY